MGPLIRIPEKPLHTFLFNCFSKLPSPHLLASAQTKSNKQQGKVQSFQPSKNLRVQIRKSVCVCHLKMYVSFYLRYFSFISRLLLKGKPCQFISLDHSLWKPLGSCSPDPFDSYIYTLFVFISSRVTLLMGGPTKEFFNALWLHSIPSKWILQSGKKNESIYYWTTKGPRVW